jgi:hypothetical protein
MLFFSAAMRSMIYRASRWELPRSSRRDRATRRHSGADHAEAVRLDGHHGNEPLAAGDGHLPEADLARLSQRLADDDVALGPVLITDAEVVRPLEVARVDVGRVDEAGEFDRLLGFELERVDLVRIE